MGVSERRNRSFLVILDVHVDFISVSYIVCNLGYYWPE